MYVWFGLFVYPLSHTCNMFTTIPLYYTLNQISMNIKQC